MFTRTSAVMTACLVLTVFLSAGCFSAHSTRTYTGEMVSEDALKQIEVGRTTKDRLTTVLGPATDAEAAPGGAEILKYEGIEEVQNSSRTAFLGSAKETVKRRLIHYFQIEDGVVRRHWTDSVCLRKDSKIDAP